ncbi:hypothetical protein Q1695_010722 [Nippostrongylus brasiliensis]|nr:hypothetical protein Q1695_010722 [Nippostrongylus brasiliensis]
MRSFLLLTIFFVVPSVSARRDADQRLKACCARQTTADKECKKKFCGFNAINQNNILHFLNMCSPRNDTVRLMWDCASSKRDHVQCCKKKNVLPACMPYCQASHRTPIDYLNHLICLQNFNTIRDCFKDYLNGNPNIYGDQ